jgi:hypothetical protein
VDARRPEPANGGERGGAAPALEDRALGEELLALVAGGAGLRIDDNG